MIDVLVSLWDSKQGAFIKSTKGSGTDTIENPWINLIACTTPAWIAGNFPEYMIGGGFTSRCLFVYADKKDKLVAYPNRHVPPDMRMTADRLVADLTHISAELAGPYRLSPAALEWGEIWYKRHYDHPPTALSDDRFGGYLARKQTHLHKLAMVLAASHRDELIITDEDLASAETMLTDLERDMPEVFSKIGRTQESVQAERLVKFIRQSGGVTYAQAFKFIHSQFPGARGFEDIMQGSLKSGLIVFCQDGKYRASGEPG